MGISDWSSDGFSSDLAAGTIHACYGRDGRLRVIDTDAGQTCTRGATPLEWQEGSAGAHDSFVFRRGEENERATGRESVCQNVLVSEVDVSLIRKLIYNAEINNFYDNINYKINT